MRQEGQVLIRHLCMHAMQAANMTPSVEPAAATTFLEVTGMVTPEVLTDDVEYGEVCAPNVALPIPLSGTSQLHFS